jgi:hypothetical protein
MVMAEKNKTKQNKTTKNRKTTGTEYKIQNSYGHLIFDKGAKKHTLRKRASSTNGARETGYLYVED